MWKCVECSHIQTGCCYCQNCMCGALTEEPDMRQVPAKGETIWYRNGIMEMEFRSLGEIDERGWLKVALPQYPDEYWGALHGWNEK